MKKVLVKELKKQAQVIAKRHGVTDIRRIHSIYKAIKKDRKVGIYANV